MKRVLVVINKWWECDAALLAMLNGNARPQGSPWPTALQPPRPRPNPKALPPENPKPLPRATFSFTNFNAEIWCISDLLEHLPQSLQSSSEQKATFLPRIFSGPLSDLVIAVGTAGTPYDARSENGNVCVGTKVFLHDGHPSGTNPDSKWNGPFDQLVESKLSRELFAETTSFDTGLMANNFLAVPLNPAPALQVLMDFDNVALGTVNVTKYSEYGTLDPQTVQTFASIPRHGRAASIETTHGLIRVQSESPFLFISGITDRLGHFDQEVGIRANGQNTAAAYNAGVMVIWLLASVDQSFSHQQ